MPHPNDPKLRSFIPVDPASDFPIQNLPYGVFSAKRRPRAARWRRDRRLRARSLGAGAGFQARRRRRSACSRQPSLNAFMALGPKVWSKTRARISELLRHDNPELRDNDELRKRALVPMADVKLHLPIAVAGYTDFYSSKEHATNVGVMFRGKDNALQPNWLHMPIGYNGRASTVVVSGTKVKPAARAVEAADGRGAEFRSVQAARLRTGNGRRGRTGLDDGRDAYREAGRGDDLRLRHPQRLERARHPAMGICAARAVPGQGVRDLDQPVDRDARGAGAVPRCRARRRIRQPLAYLQQAQPNNYDMELDVALRAGGMNEAQRICRTNFKYMYWSSVQQLVHHASSGCAMNVGDLLGTGTISRPGEGPARQPAGNQLERHRAGRTARRRQAHVPRRRRFAGDARLVPGRRLSRRLWRGRGDDCGGGVIAVIPERWRSIDSNVDCGSVIGASPNAVREIIALGGISQLRRMRGDIVEAVLQMHALVRRRLLRHRHARPPFLRGPDRPRHKTAAAVRADIVQLVLDAVRAERAFIGADPRLRRIRRQVLVAIFAVRSKLQRHDRLAIAG